MKVDKVTVALAALNLFAGFVVLTGKHPYLSIINFIAFFILCWSSNLVHYYKSPGFFWFRIYGYGLRFADRSKHAPLFSERTGRVKVLKIGKWSILFLRRKDEIRNLY